MDDFRKTKSGRPRKADEDKRVPVSARIPPPLAEQLAELRARTGETLSALIEEGLNRVLKARRRKPHSD